MKYQKSIIIISLILIVFDQISKYIAYDLSRGTNFPFITKAFNTGVSFSFPVPQVLIILISLCAILAMIFFLKKKIISPITFILVFSGTIGNLIDRIRLGGVRDFIQISTFPIFNLADSFLTLGAFFFFLEEIVKNKWTTKPKNI